MYAKWTLHEINPWWFLFINIQQSLCKERSACDSDQTAKRNLDVHATYLRTHRFLHKVNINFLPSKHQQLRCTLMTTLMRIIPLGLRYVNDSYACTTWWPVYKSHNNELVQHWKPWKPDFVYRNLDSISFHRFRCPCEVCMAY